MTGPTRTGNADLSAQCHGAVEDGAEPRTSAAPSDRLVEANSPPSPSVVRSSPPGPEGSGGPDQGLLLVHNCTQTRSKPKQPRLPEPSYGWSELFTGDTTIGFRPAEAVDIAASMFPALDPDEDPHQQGEYGEAMTKLGDGTGRWLDRTTGEVTTVGPKAWTLTISGGLIRVAVNDVRNTATTDSTEGLFVDAARTEEPDDGETEVLDYGPDTEAAGASNVVGGFSRRSRNRCRAAAASVDWQAAKRDNEHMLMVTCTYPGNWRACAPTPDHVLRHRRALEMRFLRAVGHPLAVIWKREFQDRGAPHLHLFGWWPWSIAGINVTHWLSTNWFEIVDSKDPRHLLAGTGVDHKQSLKMSDPSRVGNYFASYATAKGYKDYQNHAPDDWTNPNGSVGRYWGYVGLQRLGAEVGITESDMAHIERLLRGVLKSQQRTQRTRLSRKGKRPDGMRKRMVNRRYRLPTLKGTDRGFMFLTNDGAQLAYDIARALQLNNTEPWPTGQRRELP